MTEDSADLRPPEVAIVGGGPAGLMAAEVLARSGAAVTVFERMPTMGRKLLVAGRGGLNLTHSEALGPFLDRYGPARDRIGPAVEHFDPDALQAWCEGLGQATFVGTSGRVFPVGLRATPLLRAWLRRLDEIGVSFKPRHTWIGWNEQGALRFDGPDGAIIVPVDACVLAMGGASWPRTGSDGSWVPTLEGSGVAVSPLRPANCGFRVSWSDVFRDRFAGVPVKDIELHHGGRHARGDLMITETGIEGGPVYALSSDLRAAIDRSGSAELRLSLFPDASLAQLRSRLSRRRPNDSDSTGLRRAGLVPIQTGLLREGTANQLPRGAGELAALMQSTPLHLTATQPITRAISTAGGVAFTAIDEHFMLVDRPGTFVAGEMIDWEAPTGGYLLQAAFSTGVAAAEGALAWIGKN